MKNYLHKIFKPQTKKSSNFINFLENNIFDTSPASCDSYRSNVIVYRCINLISQAASHVPWIILNAAKDHKLPASHPIYGLLHKPNPESAGAEFFSNLIASKLLFGNAYLLAVSAKNHPPQEIYLLHAPAVELIKHEGIVTAYKYRTISNEKIYPIDLLTRMSKILHIKNPNPLDKSCGISCLEAASMQIELHNQATIWNSSLLKNGARPSGALVVKNEGGYLTDEQFSRLYDQLTTKFTSSNNVGKPLLLEGGLDWQEMSINPKDMDFIESKNSAAREIALAFGVPPQLLGISGDNTYSNMQEARLALWEETIIPLLDTLSDSLSNWLSYWFEQEIIIDFDRDHISALTEKRENLWAKISDANFMTINEKRSFFGLPPIKNGDQLQ